MDQKGMSPVIIAIIVGFLILILLLWPKGGVSNVPTNLNYYTPSLFPSPTEKTYYSYDLKNIEDAVEHPEAAKKLQFCDSAYDSKEPLTQISPDIGKLSKTEHLDLSNNNLTSLPTETGELKNTLRELVLVGNSFNLVEQEKIRKLLPYTRIAFSPQKNFDPYFKDSWERYESNKYGFSFRYHPELLVKETDTGLSIENEFASMNSNAFDSCAIEDGYIRMFVTVEDNPDNLTPIQYIGKIWEINPKLQGEEYIVENEQERQSKMIGKIKKYKNGDIDGVIADAGESEHPRIVAARNGKIYEFQYLPGGQTGSRIAEISKQTIEQTLATVKFTN